MTLEDIKGKRQKQKGIELQKWRKMAVTKVENYQCTVNRKIEKCYTKKGAVLHQTAIFR